MTALALNPSNEVRPLRTDASGALLIALQGGASMSAIKTIQKGTITINGGASSNTFTLPTTVNAAKSVLILNGFRPNGTTTANAGEYAATVELTNGTTVTATRGSSPAFAVVYAFTVVEFN